MSEIESGRHSAIESPRSDGKLAEAVHELAVAILASIKRCQESGILVRERRAFILRPNFNLRYSVDPTIMNFGVEEVEDLVWQYKNKGDFIEAEVTNLREFEVVQSLVGQYDRQLVRSFAFSILADSLGTSGSTLITKRVKTLLADLQSKASSCRAKVWLTGIRLASENIDVSDFLVLRRPERRDLQEKVTAESAHYAHAFLPRISFSCIAEYQLGPLYPMARQAAVDRLVLALRLFRAGAVSAPMYGFESDSFDLLANGTMGGPGRPGGEVYELSMNDAEALAGFLAEITPLLPTSYEEPTPRPGYLSTALNWYAEALFSSNPPERSVASATACLEALFLNDVKTELSYRLRVRVAGLMRCFGAEPLRVQEAVKDAYDVRSRYFHGDEQKWPAEKLRELSHEVVEYARLVLVAFLQLKDKASRPELLAGIDRSILDEGSRQNLEQLCNDTKFCMAA